MPMFRNLWEHIRARMPKKGCGKDEQDWSNQLASSHSNHMNQSKLMKVLLQKSSYQNMANQCSFGQDLDNHLFRVLVTVAYQRRCAITGESTLIDEFPQIVQKAGPGRCQ
jgi:hypothetical protein